jgi:hypothetical protein
MNLLRRVGSGTFLAAVLLGLSSLVAWGGSRLMASYSASLEGVEHAARIRGLQSAFIRQKISFDAYLLAGDPADMERFEKKAMEVQNRLEALGREGRGHELMRHYADFLRESRGIGRLYETDEAAAFRKSMELLLPLVDRFFGAVDDAEAKTLKDVQDAHQQMKLMMELGGQSLLCLGFFAAITGLWFLRSLAPRRAAAESKPAPAPDAKKAAEPAPLHRPLRRPPRRNPAPLHRPLRRPPRRNPAPFHRPLRRPPRRNPAPLHRPLRRPPGRNPAPFHRPLRRPPRRNPAPLHRPLRHPPGQRRAKPSRPNL